MKTFKKIVLAFILFLVISALGGYFYFDQKFSPEDNYLTVKNESGKIPLTWLGENKNALLLPIHFPKDSATYYLQFDTGSPSTILYANAIKNLKKIAINNDRAKTSFYLGKTLISSQNFKVINYGKANQNDSLKIIGTLGSDILDQRKTLINFKENYLMVNLKTQPLMINDQLFDFEFKKRKLIISGKLHGKKEKFLYDSGTSAYELLTNKEVFSKLKSPKSSIIKEESNSWGRILTSYTAKTDESILFNNKKIPLQNVTHIEGFSQTQYLLMKFSGMTGMLGNKIFLNHILYFDGVENKMAIQ